MNNETYAAAKPDILAVFSKLLKWPLAWRLGAALASVLLGVTFCYFFLGRLEGYFVYVTLFPAVAAAAVVGGVSGGIVATILSALAALMLMPPRSIDVVMLGLAAFLFGGAVIIGVAKLLRMALQRATSDDLIRQSVEQLSAFVEHAPAAFAMFDANMRYLACSSRWRSDRHLTRDVVGKSHYDVLPEIPEAWKEVHRRALAGETLRNERDSFTREDGSVRWLRWEVQPWRDLRGDIGGVIIFSEDITESVKSLELLRDSEQRLHRSLHAANAGAWEWDMNTNEVFWSDELWKIYGLAPDCEPTFDAWRQTIHPDDRDAIAQTTSDAVAKGDDLSLEWRTADTTRGERWLLSRGGLLQEADQPAHRYLGVVIDITERKRAQQGALEDKAKLEAALSAMTDAVFISDEEGHFILFNEAFVAFHRFASKKDCFTNFSEYSSLFQVFDPEGGELPPDRWPVSRALQGETVAGAEFLVRRRDTGEKWRGSYSFAPIRNADGAIVGSVATARDITQKRKDEQDLRDSERHFKAIFDTSTEGIVTTNSKGVIQTVNPSAAEMFGYETHELPGHNICLLMPEADRAGHDSHIANYPRTGAKTVIGRLRKLEGLRKNGETFRHELIITDTSVNRDVLYIGFVRDLTQIENEKRRTEAARAEFLHVSRLSDMSEAATGLAHEVSQPLTAIRTLAATARRALPSTTDPSLAHMIKVIEEEARNATDILKRLRGFIEKRESRRTQENLAKLITDALALAYMRSNGRLVRIVATPSREDIVVNVDRVQIIQVLVNFLRNASEAMMDEPDPQVGIETTMEKPGVVRVQVSDNGSGVDPKVANRLFTPFVTTKSFGMGVGLSLCKTIVQSHEGEIGCAANTPKGAKFWFTLPIFESAERRTPTE